MNWFVVHTKTQSTKWPIEFFDSEKPEAKSIASIEGIEAILKEQNGIHYRNALKDSQDTRKYLYKSQTLTIIGPVLVEETPVLHLEDVMTLNEAAEKWSIKNPGTIRKAILSDRFTDHEVKKSESVWLITKQAMTKAFGPEDEMTYPSLIVNEIGYDFETGKFTLTPKL